MSFTIQVHVTVFAEFWFEPEYYCYDYIRELWSTFYCKSQEKKYKSIHINQARDSPRAGVSLHPYYTESQLWRFEIKPGQCLEDSLTGVSSHMLDNTGLAAFNLGNAVVVFLGAGIDIHGLVNGG